MAMSKTAKIANAVVIGVVAIALIVVAVVALIPKPTPTVAADDLLSETLLPDDAHVLHGDLDTAKTVLVEFADFECPACGAFYPHVKALEDEFGDDLAIVVRNYPLTQIHPNAFSSAMAVEAAARQDRFVDMVDALYTSQEQWGLQTDESLAPAFRELAGQLGLDLEQYDADIADPALQARIEADVADGVELGVAATPTFYLDGQPLTMERYSDLADAVRASIANAG